MSNTLNGQAFISVDVEDVGRYFSHLDFPNNCLTTSCGLQLAAERLSARVRRLRQGLPECLPA